MVWRVCLASLQCRLVEEGGHMASAASAMLDSMCGKYLADERVLLKTARHFHSGTMLVEAACAGLPRPSCLQVSAAPPYVVAISTCCNGPINYPSSVHPA